MVVWKHVLCQTEAAPFQGCLTLDRGPSPEVKYCAVVSVENSMQYNATHAIHRPVKDNTRGMLKGGQCH